MAPQRLRHAVFAPELCGLGELALPNAAYLIGASTIFASSSARRLLHIDVKKLGRIGNNGPGHRVSGTRRGTRSRGAGWEYVHVCVDDATRLAYVEVLGDEKATTAIGFLRRALAFYAAHGIKVRATDDRQRSAYRSIAHALACKALGIRHIRTRPYRPRTTARRSASSARCSAAGPMGRSTETRGNGPQHCPAGLTSITGADLTAPSATGRPGLGSPS